MHPRHIHCQSPSRMRRELESVDSNNSCLLQDRRAQVGWGRHPWSVEVLGRVPESSQTKPSLELAQNKAQNYRQVRQGGILIVPVLSSAGRGGVNKPTSSWRALATQRHPVSSKQEKEANIRVDILRVQSPKPGGYTQPVGMLVGVLDHISEQMEATVRHGPYN